jgi:hypothetical protein
MKLGCFAGGLALVLIASAPSPAQDAKPKISDPPASAPLPARQLDEPTTGSPGAIGAIGERLRLPVQFPPSSHGRQVYP